MDISIIIPTKNGANTIERCLKAIVSQKTMKTYEIIAVDSGSSDNTIEILEKFGCKIIQISPLDFSHGYSRNLGAGAANGTILIFLNQDAIPYDDMWMENLITQIDGTDVAAFSRQIPYPDTHTVEKVFLHRVYPEHSRIINKESLRKRNLDESVLFSTVSAMIKKDIFDQLKFGNQIIMSEDQEFAVRLVNLGYKIRYVPESKVIHSHSYSIKTVFRRYFDSGWSLSSIPSLGKFDLTNTLIEEFDILSECFHTSRAKPNECLFSIFYMIAKSTGFILGTKANFIPKPVIEILSHTINMKKK